MHLGTQLATTVLVLSAVSSGLLAKAAELSSPLMQVTIDQGTITAIRRSPFTSNLLRSAVTVKITAGTAMPIGEQVIPPGSLAASSHSAVAERNSGPKDLSWLHEWEVTNGVLSIKTTFTNRAPFDAVWE